ncbi:hypothetical protein BaRGS_00035368 [Batillaria attramentaria]|uniref:Ras-related protein Rab-30 n=1 Tax=Batillaria attramentaria TaxID=370345 RepID=A0ABD0JEY2_9CAEN
MEDYKYLFKVVLIGNAGVGKTCLVSRYTKGFFPPGQMATIGVDFMIKTIEIDGDKVKLQIWDTAGQERFRSITQSYYRSANALILVYDVCSQQSYESNKIDQTDKREIPTHIGKEFAERYEMRFLETSAKEADNVDKLFSSIAYQLTAQARDLELRPEQQGTFVAGGSTPIASTPSCCKL